MYKGKNKHIPPLILSGTSINANPEPVRFLDRIMPQSKAILSVAEEIHQQEDNSFYESYTENNNTSTISLSYNFENKNKTMHQITPRNIIDKDIITRTRSCLRHKISPITVHKQLTSSSITQRRNFKIIYEKSKAIDNIINTCRINIRI